MPPAQATEGLQAARVIRTKLPGTAIASIFSTKLNLPESATEHRRVLASSPVPRSPLAVLGERGRGIAHYS